MVYLSKSAILNLTSKENYKYSSNDESLLSPFLQPYWNTVVNWIPLFLAPNMVTFIGFIALILGVIIQLYLCPDLESGLPTWAYLFGAWCCFFYQTMDAIDGKQARRTGASSPLGELFDHGCDSIGSTLQSMMLLQSIGTGRTFYSFLTLMLINGTFFTSIWEQYYTATLRLHVLSGPTEGEFLVMALQVVAGIYGVEAFTTPRSWIANLMTGYGLLETPLFNCNNSGKFIVLCMCFSTCIGMVSNAMVAIPYHWKLHPMKDYQLSPLITVLPLTIHMLCFGSYLIVSQHIFNENNTIALLTFGLITGYIVNRLVVARVTAVQTSYMYILQIPTLILFVLMVIGRTPWIFNANILFGMLAWTILVYSHFIYYIIQDFCIVLNVNCLSLTELQYANLYKEN